MACVECLFWSASFDARVGFCNRRGRQVTSAGDECREFVATGAAPKGDPPSPGARADRASATEGSAPTGPPAAPKGDPPSPGARADRASATEGSAPTGPPAAPKGDPPSPGARADRASATEGSAPTDPPWREYPDKAIDAVAFNRVAEVAFRPLLEKCDGWLTSDVVAEASYRLDVSPETARRYLQKYTAPSAPWNIVSGRLTRR